MKRNFTFLIAAFTLLVFMMPGLAAWGQVQSVAPANGNNYVVAAYVNNKYYALPCTTTNGSTIEGVEITLNSLNMVNTSDASGKTWTLEEGTGTNAGQYYFKYTSGGNTYYLYKNGTGGSNYNFKVSTSSKNYWSFTTNGKGYTVVAVDRGSNNVNIQCNNGTFRCYSSATAIILLEVGDVPSSGYIVTYNGNGATSGTVPTDNTEYENGATVTVLGNTGNLAQTGYTFAGWNTQSDGQGTNYTAGQTFQISDHTTLYAKWTINTHNVTMPAADQYGSYTASATSNVAYGTTVTLTYAPATGYENYAATWSMNGNAIEGNTFTMPDQNVTVTVSVAEATEATFVFNTDAGLQALGIMKPATGTGTNLTPGTDYVSGIVTMNVTHGGIETRVWNSSGNTTLRVYPNGGSLTFSVPTGYEITQIEFSGSANGFGLTNNTWNGTAAQSVTLTASAQCTIQTISVVYTQNGATVASPTLPASTTFVGSKEVTITNNEEGATIRYTIDGSDPTASTGIVYSAPFAISSTTTVKAIAVLGNETSAVVSATYTRSYTVNLTQTTDGTISANPAQAEVGQTVTLTATANVGYSFSAWNVLPVSVTLDDNTFLMPAEDVTVSATFTQSTNSCTVSFSVNNKVEMTATVFDGGSIDLTKFVAEGEGYTFEGWSTTAGGENITPQNAYTPTADITLYPGVNPAPTGDEYTLVTNVSQLEAGNLVVIAANGDKNVAMAATQGNNNRGEATITKSGNTITFPDSPIDDNPCELTLGKIVDGQNTYWTFYDANPYGHSDYQNEGYLYAASSSSNWLRTQATNNNNGKWTISISNGEATITAQGTNTHNILRYNSGSNCFSCYSSGQQTVCLYTKPAPNSAKVNRDGVPTTSKVTGIAANVLVTVKSNGVVYLTGNNAGNAANLVVEDGGQLVTSADVQGTMQKTILGYDPSANPSNGWYFISSSLKSSVNVSDVQNLINASGTDYDLYYFKQNPDDGLEWINQKNNNGFTELYEKTGYLYANAAQTTTLGFAGMLRKNDNSEQTQTVSKNLAYYDSNVDPDMQGWNLVGNPFPSYAKVDRAFFRMKNTNDGINTTVVPANSVIKPTEGVFVHASQADEKVTFTATTSTGSKSRVINIDVARQGEMLDNAIVSLNAEGSLCKLVLNENTTRVYFHQDEKDYAILTSSSENEVPVSFKASRNGSYTITVNPEDVEMNYLHLIDNMTGADVDLLANPSYTFEAKKTDYKSRFRLVFSANSIDEASTSSSFAYYNGTGWTVTNEGEATLQVVDVTGRIVSSESINGCANVNINAANGVYMLRLVNGNNVKTQKIVVK